MDYIVMRTYDGGRIQSMAMRHAGTVRGQLSVRQESDPTRHRYTLVARLTIDGGKSLPPLYDVTLVAGLGESLVLGGHERVLAGPLRDEHAIAQSWIVTPAAIEELAVAEREWRRLAELVVSLGGNVSTQRDGA